jgi:hypothetical protein
LLLSLPEIRDELNKGLQRTDAALGSLPRPPSNEPVADIYTLLSTFARDVAAEIGGTPDENGLIQAIRPLQEGFRREIRATAPQFVPYSRKNAGEERAPLPIAGFLEAEEEPMEDAHQLSGSEIFIDDVMERSSR